MAAVKRGGSVEVRGVPVFEVSGVVGEREAAALRTALVDALGSGGPRLIVDMRRVLAGAGLAARALELAAARAERRGGWVRVIGAAGTAEPVRA